MNWMPIARSINASDVAIIRLEQLYPLLHSALLEEALKPYAENTSDTVGAGRTRRTWVRGVYLHKEHFGKKLFGRMPFAPVSRFGIRQSGNGFAPCPQIGAGPVDRPRVWRSGADCETGIRTQENRITRPGNQAGQKI